MAPKQKPVAEIGYVQRRNGRFRPVHGHAAAEHVQPADAEPGINIAFANMDWNEERYAGKNWPRHLATWRSTTETLLHHFQQAVMCFCEVGVVSIPLSEQHFNYLKDIIRQAWIPFGAAAEHVEFLQTPGEPYLTAYRTDRVTCEHYSMLSNLYDAQGSERTAQHFLLKPATSSEDSINVINVHAPSGTKRLTATQRATLVRSLLQTTSLIDDTKSVGNDRYIIGGDLNTGEQVLMEIMGALVRSGACASSWRAFRQLHGKHGDMGFCNEVRGHVLPTLVHGHDPQHYPYAFRALSKQTLPPAAAEHRARPAAAEDFAPQPTPAGLGGRACCRAAPAAAGIMCIIRGALGSPCRRSGRRDSAAASHAADECRPANKHHPCIPPLFAAHRRPRSHESYRDPRRRDKAVG